MMLCKKNTLFQCIIAIFCIIFSEVCWADRVKDLTSVAGIRPNQLIGYGVVVGLDGTGDGNIGVTMQSLQSMISRFGLSPMSADINPTNTAAVMVTAELPPFAKPGQRIDVTVAAFGKSNSLRGGNLLMTPLKGIDNKVYAVSQGSIAVGGLGVTGRDGSSLTVNIPTVGRIPGGAIVEDIVPTPFAMSDRIMLNLHKADFTTALKLADAINAKFGAGVAHALDSVTVAVNATADPASRVAFLSEIENIHVDPAIPSARVIVNSRTGTVVVSKYVRLGPAAVSHGNLTVKIREKKIISQPPTPASLLIGKNNESVMAVGSSNGETKVVDDSNIDVIQEDAPMFLFEPGTDLSSIVDAINAVGATPSDLIAILEALKQAGSLRSELIII